MDTETTASPPAKQPSPLEDAQHFVATLARWRDDSKGPSQRGKLAQLKRNVGENLPGRNVLWFYEVLYQGDVKLRIRRQNEYFLLATLFDLNRFSGPGGQVPNENLGGTLRRAIQQRNANAESVRRRLQILLDADIEDYGKSEFAYRLRQTVLWLDGQQIGLHWPRLLVDISSWTHPDRYIQKAWAHAFFEFRAEAPAEPKTP